MQLLNTPIYFLFDKKICLRGMYGDMRHAFKSIDDSEDNTASLENNTNSFKLKNFEEDELLVPDWKNIENINNAPKKKKEKKKRKLQDEPKKVSNRKIVNLPASQPYIKVVDGEERLAFRYNTKISESVMSSIPKDAVEENEFCVKFDLDSVDITKLNEKFKADNCVYPRANVPYERYTGNRWNYETECNKLAWQFVSLNPVLLYGKKGLIQRAVDSYRNICKTSKGAKYLKEDAFVGDFEKRKLHAEVPVSGQLEYTIKGQVKKCKISLNIDSVDMDVVPADFIAKFSVMPETYEPEDFGKAVYKYKNPDNELAVKLAFINVENSTFQNVIKQIGSIGALTKAVELYKAKKEELNDMHEMDAAELVTDSLDKAFNAIRDEEDFFVENTVQMH
ncbi:hypothetical protein EHP00_1786 [Ecytonucleospora hepatopenaei]|uniref:DUF8032 domain-containing protein n=1 Tax=Ecytonucleospora hepatopenaei TaxID=646526 RepID=A0A1W0E2Z1_9MICR|nr:hypothetical protein EHP00_1786 [Ecytonucleospora hepatopenaei]